MRHSIWAFALLLPAFLPSKADACSICTCGDPLASAGDARGVEGQVRVALDFEALSAEAQSDHDPALTDRVDQLTLRPLIAFNPKESVTLLAQVPITRKRFGAIGGPPTLQTGLGDVDLGVRVFLWESTSIRHQRRQSLALSAGSSLPTGSNAAQEDGFRLEEHAQLGTGAIGFNGGVLYAYRADPWNWTAALSVKARLQNPYDYTYGPAALWSLRSDYRLLEKLAVGLGVDGRYAARDLYAGALLPSTGGLVIAAVPSIKVGLVDELWLHGTVQVPFYTHLFGAQHVGPTFLASLQYSVF